MASHAATDSVPLLTCSKTTPTWTGNAITSLSLHRRAPIYLRLDALPFTALYSALFSVWLAYGLTRFVGLALLTTVVILHILAFLLQHWSLRAKAFMSWIRVYNVTSSGTGYREQVYALLHPRPHRGKAELVPLITDDQGRIHFSFQKRTYEHDPKRNVFEKVAYPTKLPIRHYVNSDRVTTVGLSGAVLADTTARFGPNRLEMPAPTFSELYKESLLAPFFVFQVFCVFLWLLEDYWQYSVMTLVMMLIFEATIVAGRLRSLKELRGMRNPSHDIYAYRDKKWVTVTSLDLLPGDIVSIVRGQDASAVVPCDLLILSGSAVINEAMLTGESVPLMKEAIAPCSASDLDEALSIKKTHKAHILFGGTRVLTQTPGPTSDATPKTKPPDNGCVCFVLRTGFGSSQGKLMRTILFSTESVSANSMEAAMLLLFLLIFAIAASGYVLYHRYSNDADARYKLLLRCVLIITSVVPPELPMQLAVAVNTSLIALARNQVFCTEPYRIPYAGKIDVCCFDKTGTLTTDSINAAGVALPPPASTVHTGSPVVEYPLSPVADASTEAAMVLAACHSLVHVDNELVGDPLELASLEAVQWMYGRSGTSVPKRGGASSVSCRILQRFRFASALQRMSVIAEVAGENAPKGPRVLVKGSPEAVGKLLAGQELPPGYAETSQVLARGGMRVLALAHKALSTDFTASQASKVTRAEAESDLTFAGFVCFECPLRIDSRKIVRMLRKASHMVIMITGDATLTAAHVATQVGMATRSLLILDKSEVNPGTLEWFSASSGRRKKRFAPEKIEELSSEFDLCVAGPALEMALEQSSVTRKALQFIKVYARMSPDQKEKVLSALKESGLFTLMCGDGTNDVGALKQAHVGVALLSLANPPSEGVSPQATRDAIARRQVVEAAGNVKRPGGGGKGQNLRNRKKTSGTSVAAGSTKMPQELQREVVSKKMEELNKALAEGEDQAPLVKLGDASIASPFTSRRMTIDSCASIIRQGRCTLATTLQMYQILALNCLISAYSLSVLYLEGVVISDRQMMITGLLMAIAFFMVSRSKPLRKLSPERPASTVFAPELFVSLLGQFAVHVASLIVCTSLAKPYLPKGYSPTLDTDFTPSILNTVIFLLTISQQVSVFVLNYKGRPYMQGLTENKALLNSLVLMAAIVVVCTAEFSLDLNEAMELTPWPSRELQVNVGGVIFMDFVGSTVVDRLSKFIFSPKVRIVD